MWRRAIRAFEYHDQRGKPIAIQPGQLVDILNRDDDQRFMALGVIGPREISSAGDGPPGQPARAWAPTQRCGIWMETTPYYSGGRVHVYQYAWALAANGWEVFLITNMPPRWAADYPGNPRLRVLIDGRDGIPSDLDMIVTDNKGRMGTKAWRYKERHQRVPLVCFNFETPNWVAEYVPKYAEKLHQEPTVFAKADLLISNSQESAKWLAKWLAKDIPSAVVNPAVNTFAMTNVSIGATYTRPYFVWSARAVEYKGARVVSDAVAAIKGPADLVVFGNGAPHMPQSEHHHVIFKSAASESEKMGCMKGAIAALAPSLFEGYGMVPGESMAMGTPAIVYDLPVLREAYGNWPIYVPWNDAKAFSAAVAKAYKERPRVPADVVEQVRERKGLEHMRQHVDTLPFHAMTRPRVSAHCIVYWGFVPQSIESIYPYVDEIRIAYGPTEHSKDVPPDGSLERLKAVADPAGKIVIEERPLWRDKLQKREWATKGMKGNYHVLLDGDEIWTGLDKWIAGQHPFSCPRWVNLWHDAGHWVYDSETLAGLRWGKRLKPYGSVCPHYRWSWWRNSYVWHQHPVLVDIEGHPLHLPNNGTIMAATPESMIYHLGHALPTATMRAKHAFYRNRDGDNPGRRARERVWHEWAGKVGDCGDGIIAKVDWELPGIVQRGMEAIANMA